MLCFCFISIKTRQMQDISSRSIRSGELVEALDPDPPLGHLHFRRSSTISKPKLVYHTKPKPRYTNIIMILLSTVYIIQLIAVANRVRGKILS